MPKKSNTNHFRIVETRAQGPRTTRTPISRGITTSMSKSRPDRVLVASDSDEGGPPENSPRVAGHRRKQSDKTTPMQIVTRSKSGKLKQRPGAETRSFLDEIYHKLKGGDNPNPIKDKDGQAATKSRDGRATRTGPARKNSRQKISCDDENPGAFPLNELHTTPQVHDAKVQDGGSITSESKKSTRRGLARKKSLKNGSCDDVGPNVSPPCDLHGTLSDRDIETLQDGCGITSESKKTTRRGLARKNSEAVATPNDVSTVASAYNASIYSQAGIKPHTLFQDVEPCGTDAALKTSSIRRNQGSKEIPKTSKYDDTAKLLDDLPPIRSPTPPRVRPKSRPKTKSVSKIMSRALKALDQVRARLEQTATPQRKSHRADSDVELLYEENKTRVQVKVRYLLAVHRIEMKASEPFHALTTKLAEVTGQDEKTLTLYLRDCCLGLSESPLSVNLTVADIIECHCMKPEADQVASSNHINLVIRSVAAKTRTTLSANIRNPMKEVMDKYAAMNNLNSSTLVFTFDGDELYPLDTPLKLDLEDGDCIDV